MRTFRKILVGIGLAGVLSLSVIWGTRAPAVQQTIGVAIENIQKPGHVALADAPLIFIQKPGPLGALHRNTTTPLDHLQGHFFFGISFLNI